MNRLLLSLIQPFPIRGPVSVTREDLSVLRNKALQHNLLMLLYSRMKKYRKEISPAEDIDAFLGVVGPLYYKNAVRSLKQEAVTEEIVSVLKDHGVPSIVIRGNEIAKEIYREPCCRTSADIDILVRMSDVLNADSVLSGSGYQREDNLPLEFWMKRLHHAVYRRPGSCDIIELHWNFGIPNFFRLGSEDIWEAGVFSGSGVPALLPEMTVIQLLIHHHMHAFRELRILTDILWSFHIYETKIDWNRFFSRLEKIGLITVTRITLSQMQDLWKETTDEMISVRVLREAIKKEKRGTAAILPDFFKMDDNKAHVFQARNDRIMSRFALDRWSTILYSFVKTVLPSPESIKHLYRDRRNWTLPVNYLKFMRWRMKVLMRERAPHKAPGFTEYSGKR